MSKTRRYMLVNPDLYKDLTTRLKFATTPEVKQLISTDQEVENILKDESLPPREKRRILSEALRRLETYKTMVDMEGESVPTSAATSTANQREPTRPEQRRVRFDIESPIFPTFPHPLGRSTPKRARLEIESSSSTAPLTPSFKSSTASSSSSLSRASPFTRTDLKIPAAAAAEAATSSTIPLPSLPTTSASRYSTPVPDTYEEYFESVGVPQNYRKSAMEVVKAIESVDSNMMSINNKLQVLIKNQPTIHLTELLKNLSRRETLQNVDLSANIQRIMGLLAKETDLSLATINNPAIRHYFEAMRSSAASASSDTNRTFTTRTSPSRQMPRTGPRIQQSRILPGNPNVYRDWEEVDTLPYRMTRQNRPY